MARPLLASICAREGALVPSRRTMTGMLTPTSLTAAMMPSAMMSQRTMPPKILIRIARDLGIRQNQLERRRDALLGGAAAHIQEIRRLAAVQLNQVHGRHGQAGAIHHAGDIAVERHIVEFVLRRLALHGILLRVIAHRGQILVPKQRVVFDVDLGIQGQKIAVRGDDQRIDLHQAGIAFQIQLVDRVRDFAELRDLRAAKP